MVKKTLAAFTATAVAISAVAPIASAATFKDLNEDNPHFDAIQTLKERGVISGFEDGTFRPYATITRGQAAKILANILNLDTSLKVQKFKDVSSNHEYAGAINALVEKGIIQGYPDGTFKPNQNLTRGQMAKIIVKAFELNLSEEGDLPFTDVSANNEYKPYIQTLFNLGITVGTTKTTFSPSAPIARGQMASFVVRSEKVGKKEENVPTSGGSNNAKGIAVNGTIESINRDNVKISGKTYSVPDELKTFFGNSAVLKDATIEVETKNGKITSIKNLIINEGSLETPLAFDGWRCHNLWKCHHTSR